MKLSGNRKQLPIIYAREDHMKKFLLEYVICVSPARSFGLLIVMLDAGRRRKDAGEDNKDTGVTFSLCRHP